MITSPRLHTQPDIFVPVCILSQQIAAPQHVIFFEVQVYIFTPPANLQDERDLSQMSSVFFVGDEMKQTIVMEGLI